MLFDLQGKRRRLVQVTYLMLALLMGGGLVLLGIGSDAGQGGLLDAFKDGGGDGGAGNDEIEKRIERNEGKLTRNASSEPVRKELARDYFQLATTQTTDQGTFSDDGRASLSKAAANWKAYLALEPERPDSSLAQTALQIFGPSGLNQPAEAKAAASVIAEAENSAAAYINLVQYATLASDKRTADLAGEKAIDLATKSERKEVKAAVKQAKKASAQPPTQGG